MIIKKLPMVLLGFALARDALAGGMYSRSPYDDRTGWPFVATLSVGPAWSRPGESQVLTLQPNVNKAYIPLPTSRTIKLVTTAQGTNTLFTGEIFLGLYGQINSVVTSQIGLAFGASSQVRTKGNVFEDSDIEFGNFTYSYGIRNVRGALKAKFLYDPNYYDLLPYISGSAGIGYNHSSGFTINTRLFQEIPAPSFSDESKSAFSYTLGAGLETYVDDNWHVGLGYEFADWGRSNLGPAIGQTLGTGPHINSLRTHELQISISYVS
ncbi:outer membrane protein [Legionella maceachernii]|uniref:Outer membrane protein beta-barrel domain-containing protein n=1 Tax=Legionella maceachernii TaxID=466 RepID=A0A0W0VXE4_9GAMM|nr:outer membrane beta-barrel protein [Legionella maceachernii]KTD24633.1 hypothetical protein Lmac_2720 [Legionella maceachernii]SKA25057.1 Outer membrane protein beta-barrel domain-containing protein [Legionella maceachernii]SUO99335.1 Opacity protein and related surface antigens [Legionella maceachernii]